MGAADAIGKAVSEHDRMVREETGQWMNPEDIKIPKDMPQPQLWRILVAPIKPESKSKGGIVLPDASLDNVEILTNICKVLAVGPMAGKKPEWLVERGGKMVSMWDIKVGDLVVIGQYAGQRFEFRGLKAILLNDDEVLAKASSVAGFRVYL